MNINVLEQKNNIMNQQWRKIVKNSDQHYFIFIQFPMSRLNKR